MFPHRTRLNWKSHPLLSLRRIPKLPSLRGVNVRRESENARDSNKDLPIRRAIRTQLKGPQHRRHPTRESRFKSRMTRTVELPRRRAATPPPCALRDRNVSRRVSQGRQRSQFRLTNFWRGVHVKG